MIICFKAIISISVSFILVGCSNNSEEIELAKKNACDSIYFKDESGRKSPMIFMYSDKQTKAFDELAKLDEKYNDVAIAVHQGYLLAMSTSGNASAGMQGETLIKYQEQIAKISQFCAVVDLDN